MSRVAQLWKEETAGFQPRLMLAQAVLGLLPPYMGMRVRAAIYRAAGFQIGHGTLFWGNPRFTGTGPFASRLSVGEFCWFNLGVTINLGAQVTIEDRVALGHEVMILTDSHRIGLPERRAGELTARPVRIGAGAWLGARCMVLPGVSIGPGAVIAAGAVVTRDIPANVLAAGVPARVIRDLEK